MAKDESQLGQSRTNTWSRPASITTPSLAHTTGTRPLPLRYPPKPRVSRFKARRAGSRGLIIAKLLLRAVRAEEHDLRRLTVD
jgi:hypothetical protein